MNAIILCGGSRVGEGLRRGGSESLEAVEKQRKTFRTKGTYNVGHETIIQRATRMLHENGITDITVAYTYEKPEVEGTSFRQVKYRKGAFSTIYQCRDLIDETLIIYGDSVFSEATLKDVLRQNFDEILIVMNHMILTNPKGATILQNFFDEYGERIMAEELGSSQHFLFAPFMLYPIFRNHFRLFVSRYFITDCDHEGKRALIIDIIKNHLDKGKEPDWLGGWQKRLHGLNLGRRSWILELGE